MVFFDKTLGQYITLGGSALFPGASIFFQLFYRVNYLDGSLDKWWLMIPIFWVPPFSFLPAFLMWTNFVAKGQGGNPVDIWVLIPIMANLMMGFLIGYFKDNMGVGPGLLVAMAIGIPIVAGVITFFIRNMMSCNKQLGSLPNAFDVLKQSIISSVIVQAMSLLMYFVVSYGSIALLPTAKLGVAAGVAGKINKYAGLVGDVFEKESFTTSFTTYLIIAIFYFIFYVMMNMYNGMNAKDFCGGSIGIFASFGGVISLLIVGIASYLFYKDLNVGVNRSVGDLSYGKQQSEYDYLQEQKKQIPEQIQQQIPQQITQQMTQEQQPPSYDSIVSSQLGGNPKIASNNTILSIFKTF